LFVVPTLAFRLLYGLLILKHGRRQIVSLLNGEPVEAEHVARFVDAAGGKRYGMLSGYSIHAAPNGLPTAHNPLGRALTAPVYQEAGFILAINEIALPVAFTAVLFPNY